jgi:hypothetical protein
MGGVSAGPYASLNVSYSVGDEWRRANANRDLAGRTIEGDGSWHTMRQVHGSEVVRATSISGSDEADAIWTDEAGRLIGVLVADCVPVLLAGDGTIGAAHAGWRGLVGGVIANAARTTAANRAYAGPAIGPCCFEVGDDVRAAFEERFGTEVLVPPRHVDLWAAAEASVREAGVTDVHTARICVSCHPDVFFSHRRDAGRTGRQALIARLDP